MAYIRQLTPLSYIFSYSLANYYSPAGILPSKHLKQYVVIISKLLNSSLNIITISYR